MGIKINGIKHTVDDIKLKKKLKRNSWFEVKLTEGKNREIRNIFESLNLVVNRIIRTNYGSYSIKEIKLGEFKKIKADPIQN